MAENEILDVGNPRRYRHWRNAIADPSLSPEEASEPLVSEFLKILQGKLRKKPIYQVLKACGRDSTALREAIENLRDRALAKVVQQAYGLTRSRDPSKVAPVVAELLIGGLVDKSNKFLLRHDHNLNRGRQGALERAALLRIDNARTEIVGWLNAALRNEPIRRVSRKESSRRGAGSLVSSSLLHRQDGNVSGA
jgi:hypothetical protein